MAYLRDILATMDDSVSYKVTVIGKRGVVIEGFKGIVAFAEDRIVFRIGKENLSVTGEKLQIIDLADGMVNLRGTVSQITVGGDTL